ncbi:ribosomal RNA assembly protein [Nematocida sp. AWRm80]|nr:ribosomal RNA assembly protein [Nematocida sp. AWRm80]
MATGAQTARTQEYKGFDEKGMKAFLEESTFEIMFPRHREKYIQETEEYLKKAISQKKLSLKIDYTELVLTLSTTTHTRDPYAIIQGRDMLKLVSRGVPLDKAIRVFEEGISSDIIQINQYTRNKTIFVKRRERLIGPNGNTLKSLELLTDTFILPYGNTVSAIGTYNALKEVRRVVIKCMENIHPIYEIKRLMIKRELEKDPNLKNENWERYLPQYTKTHSKKQPAKPVKKRNASPFPAQETRKMDQQIETGEYFSKEARDQRKAQRNNKKKPATEETEE